MEKLGVKSGEAAAHVGENVHNSAATKNNENSAVKSFNVPEMDVRLQSHEVSVSQANICSKTCNSN